MEIYTLDIPEGADTTLVVTKEKISLVVKGGAGGVRIRRGNEVLFASVVEQETTGWDMEQGFEADGQGYLFSPAEGKS